MPTELASVLAQKRDAQLEMQNDMTVVSIWFVAALVVIILLLVSDEFAEGVVLMGSY